MIEGSRKERRNEERIKEWRKTETSWKEILTKDLEKERNEIMIKRHRGRK